MTLRSLVVILLAAFCSSGTSLGQETSAPKSPADAPAVSDDQSTDSNEDQKEKKRQLEIGMILVGGILILGIFLLVLTLLSSRRLKRTAAHGRQPTQPRDELWYLKNPPDPTLPENTEESE